jgi:hypothetical protein
MTQLRQKMLEELQRRHYSDRAAKTYIRIVRDFAAYFPTSPLGGSIQPKYMEGFIVCLNCGGFGLRLVHPAPGRVVRRRLSGDKTRSVPVARRSACPQVCYCAGYGGWLTLLTP